MPKTFKRGDHVEWNSKAGRVRGVIVKKVISSVATQPFAKPELYEALEERDVKYAIRLPANDNLQRKLGSC
jgi:hypothetical protein